MQHESFMGLTRRALRLKVCQMCYQRWPGRLQNPLAPRACEPTCTIFANLQQLLIASVECPRETAPDDVIRHYVCPACQASAPVAGESAGASAGDFCIDRLTRTCPLSRYGGDVLAVLEDTLRAAGARESSASA
jgi:hypothetical protein